MFSCHGQKVEIVLKGAISVRVFHGEALPKLQKRAKRNVFTLSWDRQETAGEGFPWRGRRLNLWQRLCQGCVCASTSGEAARTGPKWGHDALILSLGTFWTSHTELWSGCHGGFSALPAGYFTFSPHAAILKLTCISLDTSILQNLQVCSCHVSCVAPPRLFLLLNSPYRSPPWPCQCICPVSVPPSCISSRAAEPVANPWNSHKVWSSFGGIYQFLLTLTLFIVHFCSCTAAALLLSKLHFLFE